MMFYFLEMFQWIENTFVYQIKNSFLYFKVYPNRFYNSMLSCVKLLENYLIFDHI
eukprot:UN01328